MLDEKPYHVEVGGRIAAIYVVQRLTPDTAERLLEQATALPDGVEVLSLHVPQLDLLSSSAGKVVGRLRREWLAARKGPFRLTMSALGSGIDALIETRA